MKRLSRLSEKELSSSQKKTFLLCLVFLLALAGPFLAGPQADFNNDAAMDQANSLQ